jgi:hypothetical protein
LKGTLPAEADGEAHDDPARSRPPVSFGLCFVPSGLAFGLRADITASTVFVEPLEFLDRGLAEGKAFPPSNSLARAFFVL